MNILYTITQLQIQQNKKHILNNKNKETSTKTVLNNKKKLYWIDLAKNNGNKTKSIYTTQNLDDTNYFN